MSVNGIKLTREDRLALADHYLMRIGNLVGPYRSSGSLLPADWKRIRPEIGKAIARIDQLMKARS